MGEAIASVGKPTLFVMEGGYAVEEIGLNTVNVLLGFENAVGTHNGFSSQHPLLHTGVPQP